MKSTATRRTGRTGETIAAAYLRALGYEIRAANLRLGRDEVDLIAFDPMDSVLVFVEVKARTRWTDDYAPQLNLTPRKRACMARAARKWVSRSAYEGGYRLDLLCVAAGRVVAHHRELAWPA